ncbi:MAG: response regulator transcription factor [Oscillospiraceae bacterium]|nr:response regulator transcription factor [Oscillospiraceae bacterium]
MKQLIYIIEDDTSLQELYGYALENDFDYQCFANSSDFFVALTKKQPDLIVLDVMLPEEDGFTILNNLKSGAYSKIPVIMVSAKNEEASKVKGLNMGADDYISKPFSVLELVARIKANLRKQGFKQNDSETSYSLNSLDKQHKLSSKNVTYKDIAFIVSKHSVTVNGKTLQTTLKEYKLLYLLCKNAETVQEREVIFQKVWGSDFIGETRTLDIHIKQLRKKLAESESVTSIQTVRGVGYMLS